MNPKPVSNRKLTLLRKLNQKKYRYNERLFLLEGARAVEQVLHNKSISIEGLYFDENQQYWLQESWRNIAEKIDCYTISKEKFAEVSDTDTPQGVLAVCRMPREIATDQLSSQSGLVIAFDGIQDPGNLGTIIRTATWFGVRGMLSGKGTVDLFHPKVVRGTAGATGQIPHKDGDLPELLPVFEAAGWTVFLLDAGTESISLAELSPAAKTIIVVGNEAHGVDANLFANGRKKVRIPPSVPKPAVESLNAGVAASIALYAFSE